MDIGISKTSAESKPAALMPASTPYPRKCYLPFILYPPAMYRNEQGHSFALNHLELDRQGDDFVLYVGIPFCRVRCKACRISSTCCRRMTTRARKTASSTRWSRISDIGDRTVSGTRVASARFILAAAPRPF